MERRLGYTRLLTRSAMLDMSIDVCGESLNAFFQVLSSCHHRTDHPTPHPSIRLLQALIRVGPLTFNLCGKRINEVLTNSRKGPNYLHISPRSTYISPLIGILHCLYCTQYVTNKFFMCSCMYAIMKYMYIIFMYNVHCRIVAVLYSIFS